MCRLKDEADVLGMDSLLMKDAVQVLDLPILEEPPWFRQTRVEVRLGTDLYIRLTTLHTGTVTVTVFTL
jgi:hypothetical protein